MAREDHPPVLWEKGRSKQGDEVIRREETAKKASNYEEGHIMEKFLLKQRDKLHPPLHEIIYHGCHSYRETHRGGEPRSRVDGGMGLR